MKKRSVSGNETSSRQLLRRQTRSNANSKQTPVEDETEKIQHKRHKVRLADIQESPTKKSPETNSYNRQDNLKVDARLETPKSNKKSYLYDSTPFKDDYLLASQGYDTQCDVRWDCTSPDALRYIRKNRRRHHSSDVADIVQLLVPAESQEEDTGPSTTTPPLLGLWMNSSNQPTHASKEDTSGCSTHQGHSSKLVRFRKKERARSNANRDAKMPTELLEKLKLAVERCNGESTEATEVTIENERDTRKDANLEGFDQSKDLFASVEAARSMLNRPDTSPVPDPNLNWSDDDIFEDDSFLMKATQDPGMEPKGTLLDKRGNKRKSHEIEESQKSKISKVCSSTRQEPHNNLSKNRIGEQAPGVIPYKMLQGGKRRSPSPFRKVKSFNDIDSVQTKHSSKGRKCLSLRNFDNATKTQSITNVSTSNSAGRITVALCSSVSSNQATQSTNNLVRKQFPASGHPSVECRTSVDLSGRSDLVRHVPSTATNSIVAIGGSNSLSTKTRASTCQSGNACSSGQDKVGGEGPTAPGCTTSHNLKSEVNISSRTYVVSKSQKTSSCIAGNRQKNGLPSLNPAVSKSESNKMNSVLQCTSSVFPSTSTTTTCRRRSSGMFNTSLSDDLLCQLAEPDELLDSQASPTTNNNVNVQSQGVGTGSLNGKPQRGVTTCVSVSSDRPKSSILLSKGSNVPQGVFRDWPKSSILLPKGSNVPHNSSVKEIRCANHNIAQTKQSHVVSASEPVCVDVDAVIPLSQVPSTQRSKFKFKSKSMSSGIVVPAPVSTITSRVSTNLPTSVSAPELNKITATAATSSSGPSLVDNSEDLFISDEDELSEQQILAMLDTVEMGASQIPTVHEGQQCLVTTSSALPIKCSMNEIEQKKHAARAKLLKKKVVAVSPEAPSVIASPTKLSPTKYTQDEIQRKKQAALEKRRVKIIETLPEHDCVVRKQPSVGTKDMIQKQQSVGTKHSSTILKQQSVGTKDSSTIPKKQQSVGTKDSSTIPKQQQSVCTKDSSTIQCNSSVSPGQYHQDDIERKRLAAVERLRLKEESVRNKCASVSSDRNSLSPGKCTQDEIERKKLAALERKKHASGDVIKVRHQSDSSPGISSSQSAESSPFKCTPDEIEKKKLAALAKLKIRKNLTSQLSSKGN